MRTHSRLSAIRILSMQDLVRWTDERGQGCVSRIGSRFTDDS